MVCWLNLDLNRPVVIHWFEIDAPCVSNLRSQRLHSMVLTRTALLGGQDKFGVGALGNGSQLRPRKISAASPPQMIGYVAGRPRGPGAGSGRATESPVGSPALS